LIFILVQTYPYTFKDKNEQTMTETEINNLLKINDIKYKMDDEIFKDSSIINNNNKIRLVYININFNFLFNKTLLIINISLNKLMYSKYSRYLLFLQKIKL